MDTRATRLLREARTKVAKSLNQTEKENPGGVVTRSKAKATSTTTRPRGRLHSADNPPVKREKAATKPKATKTAKPGRAPKAESQVKAPPDWAAIHAKEEAARAKRLSVYKKPTTTATDFNFSSHRPAPRRPRSAAAPAATQSKVSGGARRKAPTPTSPDAFSADATSLDSILNNTGVAPPRRVPTKRATMGASLSQRAHGAELESASRAIEQLQLKRMSLHAKTLEKPVPRPALTRPAATVAAAAPASTPAFPAAEIVPPPPQFDSDWVADGAAILDDLLTQPRQAAQPVVARRHTLAASRSALPVPVAASTATTTTTTAAAAAAVAVAAPPPSAYFPAPTTTNNTAPAESAPCPPAPHLAEFSGEEPETGGFSADPTALDSILGSGLPAPIDEQSKRASVHHGAMRVVKQKSKAKREPAHGERDGGDEDELGTGLLPHMTPRQLRMAATPRSTRPLLDRARAPDRAPPPPPNFGTPMREASASTTAAYPPPPAASTTTTITAAVAKSPGLMLMRTPKSSLRPAFEQRSVVAVPAMDTLMDPVVDPVAEASEAAAMQELEEIRRMEEELERELQLEMCGQLPAAAPPPRPTITVTAAAATAAAGWNAAPQPKVHQPPSAATAQESDGCLRASALAVDPAMEAAVGADEASAELIQLATRKAPRGAMAIPRPRVLGNPVLRFHGEPNQAFEFLPASDGDGGRPAAGGLGSVGTAFSRPTPSSAFAAVPSAFRRTAIC